MKAPVDFLGALLGSNARAKILRVFVFEHVALTAAFAAKRAGVSPRVAMQEITALEKIGLLKSAKLSIMFGNGKKVVASKQKQYAWSLNQNFKYTPAIAKFVHEVSPVQYKNILVALRKAGRISAVVLSGTFTGDDSRPVDLLIVSENIAEARMESVVRILEKQFGREIRYTTFSTTELRYRLTIQDRLLRETLDFPHIVLFDKTGLL